MSKVYDLIDKMITQITKLSRKGILPEGDIEGLEKVAGEAELFLRPQESGAPCIYDHVSFNKLSSAEAERLAMLAEECGEVIQAVGKILRHGYESINPDAGDLDQTNRDQLKEEITDVLAIVHMMTTNGDLQYPTAQAVFSSADAKLRYAHHQ